jgi:hypothetical protein
MPDFDIAWIGGWTSGWLFAAGMVIVFFRMLSSGRLRTGREVDEVRKDRDARVQSAEAWRTAALQKDEVIRTLLAQNNKLLSLSEVSAHVLTSLPRYDGPGEGGDPDVPSVPGP